MKIAVVGSPEGWYAGDIRRAAGERHDVTVFRFEDLASRVSVEGVEVTGRPASMSASSSADASPALSVDVSMTSFDAVLVRSMPPGSLEQVVLRMDLLGRLATAGIPVVNPPRALEAAIDKYLATALLQRAGLPVPRTVACQTVEQGMAAFESLGGDVVVKPIFGAEGRGIVRVSDPDVAYRVLKAIAAGRAALYVQEFLPHHGHDIRILLLGDVVAAIRRSNDGDWRTNAARGARCEPVTADAEMIDLARRSAHALGCPLAGVDLLPASDGRVFVLEVNAVPGWRALSRATGIDVAGQLLAFLERVAHEGGPELRAPVAAAQPSEFASSQQVDNESGRR